MTPPDLRASAVRRRRERLLLRWVATGRVATSMLPQLVVGRSPLPRARTSRTPTHQPQETISMTIQHSADLYTLGDRGQTVDAPSDDVRGRTVKDEHGERIGTVADLVVDDQERKVRFLVVEHGGFLGFHETKTLLPVDAVTKITEDEVLVDQSRDRIASAPGYDPELVDDRLYHASLYDHYGYPPYWGLGYTYPLFGLGMSPRPAED